MTNRAPTIDPPELARLLASKPQDVAALIRRRLADVRACVMFDSTRVAKASLRGGLMDRLLGRGEPTIVLPPTASKFGGMPYVENANEHPDGRFLGQINFAEVAQALRSTGAAIPDDMPAKGLLAVDLVEPISVGRIRWYPDPSDGKSVEPPKVDWVAKYEAKPNFRGSWSLRGLEFFDGIDADDELWDLMNDLEVPGVDEDSRSGHKLFGHANEALNEHYGFTPAPGRSDSIRDYRLVWRIDYDNAAGFAWGTNWLYVIIHKDDLARGALDKAVLTGANA